MTSEQFNLMAKMLQGTCEKCGYWVRYQGQATGLCYRLPPAVSSSGVLLRPKTRAAEPACGEYVETNGRVWHKVQPDTPGAAVKAKQAQS